MSKSLTQALHKSFSEDKKQLIKDTVARGLNDLQFRYFMEVAASRGLDPTLKQIHGIIRGGKLTIQVAIDGLRLIAERTGNYAGQDEPEFEYKDEKYPDSCKVTVYKLVQGHKVSFVGKAKWSEFFPGEKMGPMWKKMPETMLAKCAEAQALRKAFPSDMSGLFVKEEMEMQRDVGPSEESQRLQERFEEIEQPDVPDFIELESEEVEND